MTPSNLPPAVRDRIAKHAVAGVHDADGETIRSLPPDARRRHARLVALGGLHTDLSAGDGIGLDPIGRDALRRGVGVLIDAAEDVAHGAVGELTDAGIAAARKKAGCTCPPQFVAVLRSLLDLGVQAAFAGIRSAR